MRSDITFFTSFKAMDDTTDNIGQESAVYSWKREQLNTNPILSIGRDHGVPEFCKKHGIVHIPEVTLACDIGLKVTHPMLRSIFEVALNTAKTNYVCLINSDIVVCPGFHSHLGQLLFKGKKPFVTGIRYDVKIGKAISNDLEYKTLLKRRDIAMHRTGGSDYFAFSVELGRKILSVMPNYVMGAAAWDNWLHWAGLKYGKPPICSYKKFKIFHPAHVYRQLSQGTTKSIYEHPAVAHNMRIYKHSTERASAVSRGWKFV